MKSKILIVDDEENIQFSFGSILREEGFAVITAANSNEAKKIINTTRLDIAIIDRLLGSDDGMTLVEHINKTQPDCTTILVSAFPTFTSAALGFDHKVFAYLEKPVRKAHLCKIGASASQNTQNKRVTKEYERQLIQAQKMTLINIKQENKNPEPVQIQSLVKESLEFLRVMVPKAIEITDNLGRGMDKEILDQIFNPFFSTRPKGFGTGIGLSLTHKILKDHGGGITAQSRPGRGSVFHIFLPKITASEEQYR